MKRCAAFLTAFFVMMFSLGVCAASFSDMPSKDSEYYDALNYAVSQGYLTGSDGKIMPNDNVTRAQAAAIFVRIAKLTDKANLSNVPDIVSDAWYYDVMASAVKAGLFTASSDGKLYPDSNITRAEGFLLVYKAQLTSFAGEPASLEGVSDISSLSAEVKTALSVLVGANVLTISSGKAEPDKSVTRAELALWIYNASKVKTTVSAETASEEATEAATETATDAAAEAATEAATESTYSQQASEAMQLALGILSDGTSYITTSPIYRDGMTIVWNTGGSSSSSSSSSSGSSSSGSSSSGSSSSGSSSSGSSSSGDDSSSATEAATEAATSATESEPSETYTGTIVNENDNVVEDPFGDSDDDGDDEDDEFIIDDDDYFVYDDETETGTEEETESETEVPSDTEEETEQPSDEDESETEEETDAPEAETFEIDEDTATDEPEDETASEEETDEEASEDDAEEDEPQTVVAFFRSQKYGFLSISKRTDLV
ncbi:MAG: S-layer homology domain-containing protein [Clostridia bacterium]|nr:S-layer homology domain-containing protein [Clostridia bacterium]